MLKVTSEAAAVLKAARNDVGASPEAGLRIRRAEAAQDGSKSIAVALAFIDQPDPDDQTVEEDGLKVYVAGDLVEPLAAKTLDVRSTEQGAELVLI